MSASISNSRPTMAQLHTAVYGDHDENHLQRNVFAVAYLIVSIGCVEKFI